MSASASNRILSVSHREADFGEQTLLSHKLHDDGHDRRPSIFAPSSTNSRAWQSNGAIGGPWGPTRGTGAIGSGMGRTLKEAARRRAEEDNLFKGVADLTATSEEDIDIPSPWNQPPSPTTIPRSTATSPVRNRNSLVGASHNALQSISVYSANSRASGQALTAQHDLRGLNPTIGPFKSSFPKGINLGATHENEHLRRGSLDSFDLDRSSHAEHGGAVSGILGHVGNQPFTTRNTSQPPSRSSDGADIPSRASIFGGYGTSSNGLARASFSHHAVSRPPLSNRAQSISTQGHQQPGMQDNWDIGISALRLGDRNLQSVYSAFTANEDTSRGSWAQPRTVARSPATQMRQYESSFDQQLDKHSTSMLQTTLPRNSVAPANAYLLSGTSGGQATIHPFLGYHASQYRQPALDPYFQQHMYHSQYEDQPHNQNGYNFGNTTQQFFRANNRYGPLQSSYNGHMKMSRGSSREASDFGHGTRSALLEEFRGNQRTNRKYELKEIFGHIVEFAGDQHGSRFIQDKLATANSDEKDQLFQELLPNALPLMTDIFGNYVIQKLFEHGTQTQKRMLADQMRNHISELSVQMYGCRVVQKAFEYVLADQQAELVKELQCDILKIAKDSNGNHVVQKALERVQNEHVRFIIEAFKGQVQMFASHNYACRVVQRIIDFGNQQDHIGIVNEIFSCLSILVLDQYGNYVVQHVIIYGYPDEKAKFIDAIIDQALILSKHKFASNVVETCFKHGNAEQRNRLQDLCTGTNADGSSTLHHMMRDQFGNYVIQKMLLELHGEKREVLAQQVRSHVEDLKKYNNGKQLLTFEKILSSDAATAPLSCAHSGQEWSGLPATTSQASMPSSAHTERPFMQQRLPMTAATTNVPAAVAVSRTTPTAAGPVSAIAGVPATDTAPRPESTARQASSQNSTVPSTTYASTSASTSASASAPVAAGQLPGGGPGKSMDCGAAVMPVPVSVWGRQGSG